MKCAFSHLQLSLACESSSSLAKIAKWTNANFVYFLHILVLTTTRQRVVRVVYLCHIFTFQKNFNFVCIFLPHFSRDVIVRDVIVRYVTVRRPRDVISSSRPRQLVANHNKTFVFLSKHTHAWLLVRFENCQMALHSYELKSQQKSFIQQINVNK